MAKDERRAGHQRQPANPGSSIKGGSVVAELREADYFVGFFPCCPDGRFRGERAERRIGRNRQESTGVEFADARRERRFSWSCLGWRTPPLKTLKSQESNRLLMNLWYTVRDMGFKETIQNAVKMGVAVAAALVSVVVLLAGSVQVCLCDPDPDNCGRPCHVCVDEPAARGGVQLGADSSPIDGTTLRHEEHACNHVTLALGDSFSVPTDVPVPLVGDFPVGSWTLTLSHPLVQRMRPNSTAPPDSGGGGYLLYATRIHPLA